jgi:hypothetical protein
MLVKNLHIIVYVSFLILVAFIDQLAYLALKFLDSVFLGIALVLVACQFSLEASYSLEVLALLLSRLKYYVLVLSGNLAFHFTVQLHLLILEWLCHMDILLLNLEVAAVYMYWLGVNGVEVVLRHQTFLALGRQLLLIVERYECFVAWLLAALVAYSFNSAITNQVFEGLLPFFSKCHKLISAIDIVLGNNLTRIQLFLLIVTLRNDFWSFQ